MKLVICDFDGTLIKVQSFPLWVTYIIKHSFLRNDISLFIKFLFALAFRKLGLITSKQLRAFLISQFDFSDYDSFFVRDLKQYINFDVVERLNQLSGYFVLSSAAPACYLKHVADHFGVKFDRVVGSSMHGGVFFDNYSENKVLPINGLLSDFDTVVLFTDHYMDLPLMRLSDEIFLINPSKRTVRKVEREGLVYKVVEC